MMHYKTGSPRNLAIVRNTVRAFTRRQLNSHLHSNMTREIFVLFKTKTTDKFLT